MSDIDAEPGLYPTKTRLALLADIDAGSAYQTWEGWYVDGIKIEARFREAENAGWAVIDTNVSGWALALTDAGRAVLAAADSPGGAA